MTTQGGGTGFARLIEACEAFGPYCLIGGLAVNCYVEPDYSPDVEIVVNSEQAFVPASKLRIQFTTDERYQPFLDRAVEQEVLECRLRVASLFDVTQGKLCAYSDSRRR